MSWITNLVIKDLFFFRKLIASIIKVFWIIPSSQINFTFKKDEEDKKPFLIPFAINIEYGTIGFRNSGHEETLLRNILIERI